MTQREQLIAGLLALGHQPLTAAQSARVRSSRYAILAHKTIPDRYFFVGSAGALRFGRIATASQPMGERFRETVFAAGSCVAQATVRRAESLGL